MLADNIFLPIKTKKNLRPYFNKGYFQLCSSNIIHVGDYDLKNFLYFLEKQYTNCSMVTVASTAPQVEVIGLKEDFYAKYDPGDILGE